MHRTLILLSIFIVSFIHCEPLRTGDVDRNDENDDYLVIPHALANNYLIGLRQGNLFKTRASSDDDQQRAKRIYWENLSFHAADYNQKDKKV